MTSTTKRSFSPYERTHLLRFGNQALLNTPDECGETPVEYLTGKVEFGDLVLAVSPDTLIPRIETEGLVERAVELVRTQGYQDCADVGTGCGAIALLLASELVHQSIEGVKIQASDVSEAALEIARTNLSALPKRANVEFFHSDLLDAYNDQSCDLIIANLPYIPHAILDSLDDSVKQYEPHVALDGGADGFELIARLLDQTERVLRPGGTVLLELDYTHGPEQFDRWLGRFDLSFFPDYRGVKRFAQLDLKSPKK